MKYWKICVLTLYLCSTLACSDYKEPVVAFYANDTSAVHVDTNMTLLIVDTSQFPVLHWKAHAIMDKIFDGALDSMLIASMRQSKFHDNVHVSLHDEPLTSEVLDNIATYYFGYKRQYAAYISNLGDTIICVNAYCETTNSKWKTQWLTAQEGGLCYFQMLFNYSTHTLESMYVNGEF